MIFDDLRGLTVERNATDSGRSLYFCSHSREDNGLAGLYEAGPNPRREEVAAGNVASTCPDQDEVCDPDRLFHRWLLRCVWIRHRARL